jgi:hypothetical protein
VGADTIAAQVKQASTAKEISQSAKKATAKPQPKFGKKAAA